jgi:hypothetical protein
MLDILVKTGVESGGDGGIDCSGRIIGHGETARNLLMDDPVLVLRVEWRGGVRATMVITTPSFDG